MSIAAEPEAPGPQENGATPPSPPSRKIEIHLSLQEAIQWAVRKNLEVLAGNVDLDIARRDLIIARATFDPFFNVSATYAKNRDPSVSRIDVGLVPGVVVSPTDVATFRTGIRGQSPLGTIYQFSIIENRYDSPVRAASGFQAFNPIYSSSAQVSATQPFLKNAWFPFNTANIRAAKNNIQISRERLELLAINTVFNVEKAYWELVFAQKNFESKAKALLVTQENLRIDQKKVAVGTRARIDLTTDESQVARRKTEYDRAASLLEDTRDNLLREMNYVGAEESLKALSEKRGEVPYRKYGDIIVIPTSEPEWEPVKIDRSESIRLAFEQRGEYHEIELQIQNQDISIDVAWNQLLPSLDLSGTWTQLGLDKHFIESVERVFDGDFYDWSVGAAFEIPLSLRGPRATYRNARDLKRRLILQKQNLENSIVLEVDKAIRDIDYTYKALMNLTKLVELQQDLLKAEKTKLDVGKSIAYNVALIENDLVDFEAQLLRVKADFMTAKSAFEKAVGGLLTKRGVNLGE